MLIQKRYISLLSEGSLLKHPSSTTKNTMTRIEVQNSPSPSPDHNADGSSSPLPTRSRNQTAILPHHDAASTLHHVNLSEIFPNTNFFADAGSAASDEEPLVHVETLPRFGNERTIFEPRASQDTDQPESHFYSPFSVLPSHKNHPLNTMTIEKMLEMNQRDSNTTQNAKNSRKRTYSESFPSSSSSNRRNKRPRYFDVTSEEEQEQEEHQNSHNSFRPHPFFYKIPRTLFLRHASKQNNTELCSYCLKPFPKGFTANTDENDDNTSSSDEYHNPENCIYYCQICGCSSNHDESMCDCAVPYWVNGAPPTEHYEHSEDRLSPPQEENNNANRTPVPWCLFCAKFGHKFHECQHRAYFLPLSAQEKQIVKESLDVTKVVLEEEIPDADSFHKNKPRVLNCCNCGGEHLLRHCNQKFREEVLFETLDADVESSPEPSDAGNVRFGANSA